MLWRTCEDYLIYGLSLSISLFISLFISLVGPLRLALVVPLLGANIDLLGTRERARSSRAFASFSRGVREAHTRVVVWSAHNARGVNYSTILRKSWCDACEMASSDFYWHFEMKRCQRRGRVCVWFGCVVDVGRFVCLCLRLNIGCMVCSECVYISVGIGAALRLLFIIWHARRWPLFVSVCEGRAGLVFCGWCFCVVHFNRWNVFVARFAAVYGFRRSDDGQLPVDRRSLPVPVSLWGIVNSAQ